MSNSPIVLPFSGETAVFVRVEASYPLYLITISSLVRVLSPFRHIFPAGITTVYSFPSSSLYVLNPMLIIFELLAFTENSIPVFTTSPFSSLSSTSSSAPSTSIFLLKVSVMLDTLAIAAPSRGDTVNFFSRLTFSQALPNVSGSVT